MSEAELQNDDPIEGVQETQEESENPINGSELAPEQGEIKKESRSTEEIESEKKAKAQAVFNKNYGEKKQLERDLESERAKVLAFENQQLEAQKQLVSNLPSMPDPYDDDYDVKMQEWQAGVQNKAAFDANQNLIAQNAHNAQQAAQYKQQQEIAVREHKFLESAKEQGVSSDEMNVLLTTIGSYGGIGNDNAQAIMQDPDAASIIRHLAENPQEIAAIQQMSGYTLANHINNNIRAKAQALKPKRSNAPAPSTEVHGDGIDSNSTKHPALVGVTYS